MILKITQILQIKLNGQTQTRNEFRKAMEKIRKDSQVEQLDLWANDNKGWIPQPILLSLLQIIREDFSKQRSVRVNSPEMYYQTLKVIMSMYGFDDQKFMGFLLQHPFVAKNPLPDEDELKKAVWDVFTEEIIDIKYLQEVVKKIQDFVKKKEAIEAKIADLNSQFRKLMYGNSHQNSAE